MPQTAPGKGENMKKTIGILGGMGPLATCDLFQKIIQVTDARCDQSHVRVCVDSNTEIPDRTAAILHGGADPLPEMKKSALNLQRMGADVLIMPCNTAHYFHSEIAAAVDIPFLNMLDETADAMAKKGIRKAGLLATDGTIQSGVYHRALAEKGIEALFPLPEEQKYVMELIYDGVKAGNFSIDTKGFCQAAEGLLGQGAQTLVLGCTELPVAFGLFHFHYPCVDPTMVVASRAVQFVGAPVKPEYRY